MKIATTSRERLRRLLKLDKIVIAPGAYDAGTAMLTAQAGFPAVYMSGAGVCATHGLPDYGLLTMTEMVATASRMAAAIDVPLISDADTGYGNELNVARTVQEYERAGVAAIHLEDQVSPKRCGHLAGKEVVSREEFLIKIRAAVGARRDPDFMIIARTDSRAVYDLDEAIARANAALDNGADAAFVEATQSVEEASRVPGLVHGPCLLNMVAGGLTPVFDVNQAQEMGYRLVILPAIVISTMVAAVNQAFDALNRTGKHPEIPGGLKPEDVFRQFGACTWDQLRERYREHAKQLGIAG
jgi:2-methylisocitrate lyase-like PEP mutase family enzyme